MRQPLRTCSTNCLRFGFRAHRRAAAGRRPDRRDDRTDDQISRPHLVGQLLQIVVARVDVDVRGEQKQIDAVELDAVDLGRGRQVEHRVEIDRRLRTRRAFADDARPGGVVQLRKVDCDMVVDSSCCRSRAPTSVISDLVRRMHIRAEVAQR